MKLNIDVTLDYALAQPGLVLLAIEAAQVTGQRCLNASTDVPGATLTRVPGDQGVGERLWADLADPAFTLRYTAQVEVTRPDFDLASLPAAAPTSLPNDALVCLRPSFYCPTEPFMALVDREFGNLQGGAKVKAMRDYLHGELTYQAGLSTPATTALDTFAMRAGVCRDYAHVMTAFARAAQIPARCSAVYGLGVEPQDFHMVTEVFLEGGWTMVDATKMTRPDRAAIVAVGRDAKDIAFMEAAPGAVMNAQTVDVVEATDASAAA